MVDAMTIAIAIIAIDGVIGIVVLLVLLGYYPRKLKQKGVYPAPAKPETWLISEKYGVGLIEETRESFGKTLIKLVGMEGYIEDLRPNPNDYGPRNLREINWIGGIVGGTRFIYHTDGTDRLAEWNLEDIALHAHRLTVSYNALSRENTQLRANALESAKEYANIVKELKQGMETPMFFKRPGEGGSNQPIIPQG